MRSGATPELRELAHGILPAVLIQGGLRSGISSIVSRLDLLVEIDVISERFRRRSKPARTSWWPRR